jgi:ribosomal protein S18 acetylase RimI-like enzyme
MQDQGERLRQWQEKRSKMDDLKQQITISDTPSIEEILFIEKALEDYNLEQTQGEFVQPGIEINLVLKNSEGTVVGGVTSSTVYHVIHLEVLWVDDAYRKFGFGRDLVLVAEGIGFQNDCITSQTWTFSFQGPGFYQKIGYKLLGTYDGYPGGLTELVFMKRLAPHQQTYIERQKTFVDPDSRGFFLTDEVCEEDLKVLHAGLMSHADQYVSSDDQKGIKIQLILKEASGTVIGGLLAWTTINNLVDVNLWVAPQFRGLGLGRKLILEAERIAQENGCIASQLCSLSFQAPGFFQKMGYQVLGVSDGYPGPVKEYYFIKKYP